MILGTPLMGGDSGLGHHGFVEVDDSKTSCQVVLQRFPCLLDTSFYPLGLLLGGYLCHLDLLLAHFVPLVYVIQGSWTDLLIWVGSGEISRSLC